MGDREREREARWLRHGKSRLSESTCKEREASESSKTFAAFLHSGWNRLQLSMVQSVFVLRWSWKVAAACYWFQKQHADKHKDHMQVLVQLMTCSGRPRFQHSCGAR